MLDMYREQPNSGGISPILQNRLYGSSNQIINKNADGSIQGVCYVIAAVPSALRPVKAWTIAIEEWECDAHGDITANDVMNVRIANIPQARPSVIGDDLHVQVIEINGQNICLSQGFNALMAAFLIMAKIDAGRNPDIDKIMRLYNLSDDTI